MQKIIHRLLRIAARLAGLSILSTVVVAAVVAVRHKLETPQRLDSALPGEDHIYRWKRGHIFYKVLGAADAPPLVLLHTPGIGASAYEMRSIIAPLAKQYRVYAPDLIGFGLSDRPRMDYSAETYITLCQDFLNEVVARPAMLLASSLSCNYAIAVAANAPELCKCLVLISPVALSGSTHDVVAPLAGQQSEGLVARSSLPHVSARSPLASLVEAWSLLIEAPLVKSLLYAILSTRLVSQFLPGVGRRTNSSKADLDYFYATTHRFGAQHAPMALLAGKLAHDASQEFQSLQQPALIIWGARVLNNAHSIASQQHLPAHAQMVLLQDAGINVHEEHPDKVAANIREWSEERKTEVLKEATAAAAEVETARDVDVLVEAYCIKCKKKTKMQNPHEVTMKNGRIAIQGNCSICGTNLYRIGRLIRGSENNT